MALSQSERDAIIDAAFKKTKEKFANAVSTRTTLTTDEVLALAKTQEERNALASVLAEVTNATSSNSKKAEAIRNIVGGVETLVKIVNLAL